MVAKSGRRATRGLKIVRRSVQLVILVFFVLLVFRAAYPPLEVPPAEVMLHFDPLAGLYSLIATRSSAVFTSFWPAWVLLGLTLLSSRFFCGWICPLGTCFDLAGSVKPKVLKYYQPKGKYMKGLLYREKAGATPRRIRLKYFILALVLALGLAGVNLLYFASPLVVMNRSVYYLLLPQVPVLLVVLLLLALVYRPRFWCEELCPMGALMSLVSMAGKRLSATFSPLCVVKDAGACIDCGACFRSCDFGVSEPFLKRDSGKLRSADCTACGDCVAACPSGGALALESIGMPLYVAKGAREHPAFERREMPESPASAPGDTPTPTLPLKGGEGSIGDIPTPTVPAKPGGGDHRFTVDRREFIGSIGLGAVLLAGYGIGLREVSGPVLRMPGAQNESEFLAACNRCGECTRACPVGCIKPMGLEDGFGKLWTPRFHPRMAGCVFDQCDQACARVCPVDAIERQKPAEVKIGLAQVDKQRCLGWRGRPCLVCKERCRFNAIDANGLRPVVVTDKCTGCGACEQTCPTEPTSIRIFSLGETASWPSGGDGGGGRRKSGT